ncbi:hypothetical protein [Limoniibacter endophyticus]|uniref:Uncharacterized protein n=1 Tax=Limoniibacter endophyticus TaxID=1565040 RepID=A0A8J3DMB2_9HYPH|nr:hypothetical protein [Limoniibacter endophyticus]GHC64377.1 hypothetical protein GCM10010136_06290 [Limoniibacter endophyticus]
MDENSRKSVLGAAVVLGGFGSVAYFLPSIILGLGDVSPFLGGAVALIFVAAFFGIFWLRGRY